MSGRKLIKGTAWSLAGQVATVAVSALVTPFVVRQMGPAQYGILAFLNLLTGYLAYTDLGMGTASTRFASLEESAGSSREVEVIWAGIGLSALLGAVFAVLTIALAPAISDELLHVAPALRGQAILALRIVGLAFLLKNIAGVMNTPQLVRLRFDTYTAITSGSVLLQIVLTPIILWLGGNLATIAAMIAAVNFCALGLHFAIGRRLVPQLWPPRMNTALFGPLFSFGALVVLSQVPELILTTAERFGLTYFTSVSSLAYYSIAYTYANLSLIVAIAMGQVLLPMFSRLQSSSEEQELGRLYGRSIVSMCFTLAPVAVVLAVAARPVLTTLLGADYGLKGTPACYVLLIGIVFSGISYIPASLLFASNKGATVARIRWCELVPYLMIAAGLTMKYGVLGAAAAWTLRALVDSLLLTIAVQKWKKPIPFSLGGFLKLGGTLAFLLPPVIVTTIFQVSWVWTGILTCVCLMLYVVNLWRSVLTSSERSWVSSVSRHLLPQSAEAK
jgi:O-antigen/teichoic acid export membrane protein